MKRLGEILDKGLVKFVLFVIMTALFVQMVLLTKSELVENTVFLSIETYFEFTEGIILFVAPVLLAILTSLFKRRFLWIASVCSLIAFALIALMGGATGNPGPMEAAFRPFGPFYIAYLGISYLACAIAVCMDTGEHFEIGDGGGDNGCPLGGCN